MTIPAETTPDLLATLRARIQSTFGFDELRPMQAEAMAATLAGRDALVVLPTGGGKSLCYQAPALVREGFTIVVSPLIALMADQLRALDGHGVAAGAINSVQDAEERHATWEKLRRRELQLLYCSPERLAVPGFYDELITLGASAIAIDEAHCISHWGHDFRPEYRQLGDLLRRGSRLPILALTATATPRVQRDIESQLKLENAVILVGDFDRPNLTYRITQRRELLDDVYRVVAHHSGHAGIVYVLRRKDAESLAQALAKKGVRCLPYHAGLAPEERRRAQDDFLSERIDVVVATVAFGMGIDRSDVRFVVHAALPKGIEQYSQETGRAGRDGLPAECVMFYSGADYHGWRTLMEKSAMEAEAAGSPTAREELKESFERLDVLWNFAGGTQCRHRFLVQHFGGEFESKEGGCGVCDVCLGELEPVDGSVVIAQKILSCVVHCRQSYGATHVTNVLRGAQLGKIQELGHDRFTTFGLLAELAQSDVRNFIDQLVSQGHLLVASGQYPTLALSKSGAEVMRGERPVEFFRARAPKKSAAARSTRRRSGTTRGAAGRGARGASSSVGAGDDGDAAAHDDQFTPQRPLTSPAPIVDDPDLDQDLVEELRALRRRLARERAVPPYLLFNDRTLVDLVEKRPRTRSELLTVVGIGEKKADDLGELLLSAVAPH